MLRAIVIVLAVLLIGWMASRIFGTTEYDERWFRARIQLKKIAMAVDTFNLDTGQLPVDLSQLLATDLPGWDGPYLRPGDLEDPWGKLVIYRIDAPYSRRFVVAIIPPQSLAQHQGELILYREAIQPDPALPTVSPSSTDP